MNAGMTRPQKAIAWMLWCGAAWLVLGVYGFWGLVYGWGPAAFCGLALVLAWVILAVGVIFALIAAAPTRADIDEHNRVKAQETLIREQQYRDALKQSGQ